MKRRAILVGVASAGFAGCAIKAPGAGTPLNYEVHSGSGSFDENPPSIYLATEDPTPDDWPSASDISERGVEWKGISNIDAETLRFIHETDFTEAVLVVCETAEMGWASIDVHDVYGDQAGGLRITAEVESGQSLLTRHHTWWCRINHEETGPRSATVTLLGRDEPRVLET